MRTDFKKQIIPNASLRENNMLAKLINLIGTKRRAPYVLCIVLLLSGLLYQNCSTSNSNSGSGNGGNTSLSSPVVFAQVSSGSGHNCGVDVNGGVWCWGNNNNGQVGIGSTASFIGSAQLVSLPAPATSVSLGASHTCAIVQGQVYCWGANNGGQLGVPESQLPNSPTPIAVAGLAANSTAGSLALGANFSCALLSGGIQAGQVQCWGNNGYGQLGNASTKSSTTPVTVEIAANSALSGVTAIAARSYEACAVAGGAVMCWGENNFGQLGNGTTTNSSIAVTVASGPSPGTPLSGAVGVSVGGNHACALMSSGSVECWGLDQFSQLGDDPGTGAPLYQEYAVEAAGVVGATGLVAGGSHTCAIVSQGQISCWGLNGSGQLGTGSVSTDGEDPVEGTPVSVINITGASQLSAGGSYTCAVAGSQIQCWGVDGADQLGNNVIPYRLSPYPVPGIQSATLLSAGTSGAACANNTGGALSCWGGDGSGELGINSYLSTATPSAVTLAAAPTAVALGNAHTCAIVSGKVDCWGNNYQGQLAQPTSVFNQLTPISTGVSGAQLIAAGNNFTCAGLSNHSVECWGAGNVGQLGNGATPAQSNIPVTVSFGTTKPTAILALGAGSAHACAIINTTSSQGIVECWGQNNDGQLGNGKTTNSDVAVPVSGITGATALAVGDSHTCVISGNGQTLQCWGLNSSGQLGNGNLTNSPTPVAVVGLSGSSFTAISANSSETCALGQSGQVQCWGADGYSQLGNASLAPYSMAPVVVANLPSASAISVGSNFVCAIATGGVECWGGNGGGQLADGTILASATPVTVQVSSKQ